MQDPELVSSPLADCLQLSPAFAEQHQCLPRCSTRVPVQMKLRVPQPTREVLYFNSSTRLAKRRSLVAAAASPSASEDPDTARMSHDTTPHWKANVFSLSPLPSLTHPGF